MAKHEVALKISHEVPIAGKDVEFPVKADGASLGRVRVSRGGIDWYPRRAQKGGYALTWEDFAAIMESNGRRKR